MSDLTQKEGETHWQLLDLSSFAPVLKPLEGMEAPELVVPVGNVRAGASGRRRRARIRSYTRWRIARHPSKSTRRRCRQERKEGIRRRKVLVSPCPKLLLQLNLS